MSHYSVLVITKPNENDIMSSIADLLAPYDENRNVAPYIDVPADELVNKLDGDYRKMMHNAIHTMGKAIARGRHTPSIIMHDDDEIDAVVNKAIANGVEENMTLRQTLTWDYLGDDMDMDGNAITTSNPDAKWDWYTIGGRWDNDIPNNHCKVTELPEDYSTFAVITPDGVWHSDGDVGWFANVTGDGKEYDFDKIVSHYGGYDCVLVDCHI